MPQSFSGKLLLAAVVVVFLVAAIYAIRGYSELADLSRERDEVLQANQRLEDENHRLRAEIEVLKKDDAAVEKVARERLGLIKEDEVIYQLPE